MRSERVILSFITVIIGLIAAGVGFYIYQMTTTKPEDIKKVAVKSNQLSPTPTVSTTATLQVESPVDMSVVDNRTIVVSGKAQPSSTIIISSGSSDTVVTADMNGIFSSPFALDDGVNTVHILAVSPTNQEESTIRTVTYSTESF